MTKRLETMTAKEKRIAEKLNALTDVSTFWEDVRKLTAKIRSDKSLSMWQSLAEIRCDELRTGCEDVRAEYDYDRMGRVVVTYWTYDYSKEIKREV
jgi:hypothetical protein